MSVRGKRVLVTGAAGVLGRAVMGRLDAEGARTVGLDVVPAGDDLVVADIRNSGDVEGAVQEALARLGGLDILINNAGVLSLQDPGAPPEEHAREAIDVHLIGTWNMTAAALPALLESHGRVINIASMFAVVNAPYIPAYAATKRAVGAYSDILRMHYRGRLDVTTIFPGYMNTPIHDDAVRQGLSVGDVVTFKIGGRRVLSLEERVDAAARTVVRACSGRARRDRAMTFNGAVSLAFARHAPGVVDWFIAWRLGRLARAGMSVQLDPPQAASSEHVATPVLQ